MILTEYDEKATMDYIRREAQEIGQEIGEKIGRKYGEQINELNRRLIADDRYEDLRRSLEDMEYQKELFREYGI